ncbi:MAG: hypothetical protein GY810_06435 [Aureispira sp.]|nr:hypothetical protein [Aureispira sp.]
MINKILLFVGFLLIAVGIFVYYMIDLESAQIMVQNRPVTDGGLKNILAISIGGGIAGLGGVFLIFGMIGMARNSKLQKEKLHIMQTGIKTEGKVTFVDKNYSLLINNRPVFSIVEYTYKDKSGNDYSRRIDSINSNIVIRCQIQVGAIVAIKYKADDPSKSVILLQQAAKQPTDKVSCEYCNAKYSLAKYDSCPKCGST